MIGSDKLSADLHELSERVNKENLNIAFDYTYNDQKPLTASTIAPTTGTLKKNIQLFSSMVSAEDYHKPSGMKWAKLSLTWLRNACSNLYFHGLGNRNRDNRRKVDEEKKIKE